MTQALSQEHKLMNSSIDQLSQVSGLDVLFMGALSVRGGRETPGGEEAKGQEIIS